MASIDGTLPETGLRKGTNWWGAFVIGLAGTILVTGIAPYVVQGTGALGIILIGVMTIAGCFLCLAADRSPMPYATWTVVSRLPTKRRTGWRCWRWTSTHI